MNRHLVIFTRRARLGAVKRRLAAETGAVEALRFHRFMQRKLLLTLARDGRWRTWLSVTPDICLKRDFPGLGYTLLPQGSGDLGKRMARAFRALPPGPAVLIGSDIPGVTSGHIAQAFARLGGCSAVFGPAEDGGYWLVGFRRTRALPMDVFAGVRWSTPHALGDTLKTVGRGPRTGYVQRLRDVDTAADYEEWRRLCSSSRGMISTKLQGRNR